MADSTTINFTPKNSLDSTGVAQAGTDRLKFFEFYFDASTLNLAAASYALMDLPEGYVHLSTVVEVLTAEGGTATVDLGITGGDVDTILDGANLNAAAGTLYFSGAAGTAEVSSLLGAGAGLGVANGGGTYSLLVNNALDAAKFRITSSWLDMKGSLTQQTPNSLA